MQSDYMETTVIKGAEEPKHGMDWTPKLNKAICSWRKSLTKVTGPSWEGSWIVGLARRIQNAKVLDFASDQDWIATKTEEVFRKTGKFNMDIIGLTETKKKGISAEETTGYVDIHLQWSTERRNSLKWSGHYY